MQPSSPRAENWIASAELHVEVTVRFWDFYDPFRWAGMSLVQRLAAAILGLGLLALHWVIPPLSAALLVAGFIFCLVFLYPFLRVQSAFRKNPALPRPRQLFFSAGGVRVQAEDFHAQYGWPMFIGIIERRKLWTFLTTERGGIQVPKRCFARPDENLTLRRIVKENFKGKRLLRID